MKASTKKILFTVPLAVILLLCGCLVWITMGADGEGDLPVMATPDETTNTPETEPALPESTPETEGETEPPVPVSEGLHYKTLGDGRCVVSGYGTCRDSVILLPERSPEGDLVVGIGDYAFRNCTFLRGIELTSTINTIGAYAFYGSGLESIVIPNSVYSIGDYAFVGCFSLKNITVMPENPSYADDGGVLTDKKGESIICYPAGRVENFFTIKDCIREIRTMAFYKCDAIKLVNYCGSSSSFRRILIGAGNEVIESAVLTYSTSSDLFSDGKDMTEMGGDK